MKAGDHNVETLVRKDLSVKAIAATVPPMVGDFVLATSDHYLGFVLMGEIQAVPVKIRATHR